MPVNDRFLGLFLEESRELLQVLETGLMDLEARQGDRAHIDRTFRAAHTLKGAAGMVGLRALAEFTHGVEAVLEKIRSGALAITTPVITLLLQARDHLATAIETISQGNEPLAPAEDLVEDMKALAGGWSLAMASAVPTGPALPSNVASVLPEVAPPDSGPVATGGRIPTTYRVVFTPGPGVLREGTNPVGFLDELRELGDLRVIARVDGLPPLDDLDPQECYLAWEADLTTTAERARIDEVFLFLEDPHQVAVGLAKIAPGPATPPMVPTNGPQPRAVPGEGPGETKPLGARVRVDAERLDQLVGMAGELAVLTDSLHTLVGPSEGRPWAGAIEALERLGRLLRDATLELRMVAIEELFVRFPRVVRDIAERLGKRIDLKIEGADTLLDRTIIERLADPMVHLIRNAIDHGLEPIEERLALGKPAVGRITIAAAHEGDRVAIRISDDGRGLDRAKVLKKGIALGLVPPDMSLDDPRVPALIFEAGFTTQEKVGELSGRGVGLDVVRDTLRSLRGTVDLKSVEGQGTTFLIQLPLTLAMIDGLLVEAAGDRYVVPIGQVHECVALNHEGISSALGQPMAVVRGAMVPIVPLGRVLGRNESAGHERRELLLTRYAERHVAVAVDRLLGRVQTVIQPLEPNLGGRLGCYSGTTILGDGSVSLILDLSNLVADAQTAGLAHRSPGPARPERPHASSTP